LLEFTEWISSICLCLGGNLAIF